MTSLDGSFPEMRRLLHFGTHPETLALDDHTAERLLSRSMAPADAPPEYRLVAATFRSLAQDPIGPESVDENNAVKAIATAIAATPRSCPAVRRLPAPSRMRVTMHAVAVLAAGLSLGTGLTMAGALPGGAQAVASNVLAKFGISSPSPDAHPSEHPSSRHNSVGHGLDGPKSLQSPTGSQIPGLAPNANSTGVNKRAQTSTAASHGQSQAGQHRSPPDSTAGPSAPNTGGAPTGSNASNAHSTAGSENGGTHRP